MEVLTGAKNFTIGNFFASDGNGGKDVVAMALLEKLVKAACLGAGHQSDERYDAPKCHPETRAAVINDIMSWVNAKDSKEPIMWMSGAAGAGKSAIAQTICEKCYEKGKLIASFFFSRTATGAGRSDGNRLVPTIAHQLTMEIPEAKTLILKKLENNSAILTSLMEIQLQKLVLEPLADMDMKIEQDKFCTPELDIRPHVVVIDGLDECNDPKVQSRIVNMIASSLNKGNIKLRFLIASRPELAIRTSFESIIVKPMCARVILDEKYKPDDDIRTYLLSEFATLKREHTLQKYLLQEVDWPSAWDIYMLVEKSSGQFIYASTVIKYLKDPRRDPISGLHAIFDLRTSSVHNDNSRQNESRYAALDLLYRHVLVTSVTGYDLYVNVFQVLLYSTPPDGTIRTSNYQNSYLPRTLKNLSEFAGITQYELELLLVDLHSLLSIPDNGEVKFHHASFGDFLKDESRSGNFYISQTEAHKYIAQRCLSIILEISLEIQAGRNSLTTAQVYSGSTASQRYSVGRFFEHLRLSDFDEELLPVLRSETTLYTVLGIISNFEMYGSLQHVIVFSFDDRKCAGQPYWIPRTEKIQDICLAIVKFVEERFLVDFHSVGTSKGYDVTLALTEHSQRLRKFGLFHLRWLKFLLENPMNANHLYLDSEKSFLLYKKLVQDTDDNTRRHYGNGNDAYYPSLLNYLLQKIVPSANIDIDLFPRVSEQVLNEIKDKGSKAKDIKDLHTAVGKFLGQCRVLKQLEEEEKKQKQEEEYRLKQEEKLKRKREEEIKRQQELEEELKRQQEEELQRKHEEEFRREQEEELKKRSFRNRIITTIKDAPSKLKGKLRNP